MNPRLAEAAEPAANDELLRFELERSRRELNASRVHLAQMEAVFNRVASAIFVAELDGQIIDVNPAACELLGYEKKELLDLHPWDFLDSVSRNEILDHIGRLTSRVPATIQCSCRCKNAEHKIVELGLTRSAISGREWIVASFRNVTEVHHTERLLAGEKRLLEMVAQAEPLSSILAALCRFFEELYAGSVTSVLLADLSSGRLWHGAGPSLSQTYIDAIKGGVPIGPAEGSCGTATCRRMPVFVSNVATDPLWRNYRQAALACGLHACWSMPILSSEGKVLGTFATYFREPVSPTQRQHDVIEQFAHLASIAIERTQGREALRLSEAYLAEAQKLSQTGSFAFKLSSGEIRCSEETIRIMEFEPDTKVSLERALMRVHPEDVFMVQTLLEGTASGGTLLDYKHRLLMPDNSIKHVHVVARVMREATGTVEIFGAVMDITERKRAEEAFRSNQAELARVIRLTTIGELTASIAHEVNQPIAAVVTNANACLRWLDREPPNLSEARDALQRIVHDGNRGSDVIARIRALLKKEPPTRQQLDINQLIRDIMVLAETMLEGTVLEFCFAAEQLPPVSGDRVQLQQVVLNLVLNALDAMKAASNRPRVLRLHTKAHGQGEVLVAVEDSGIGLNPEQMKQIFDPFYTTKPAGLGLGLSISRSLVESHGGRLWFESNEGYGMMFQFTLPVEVGGPI